MKNNVTLCVGLLLICFFIFDSLANSSDEIELLSCFPVNPVIKVCEDSNVSERRIDKAVSIWNRAGYSFEKIIYNDDSPSCNGVPEFGEIIISQPGEDYDYQFLAITRRTSTKEEKMILHSIIYIQPSETTKERVLEHEIGHALGWEHSSSLYHLMYEEWILGGWRLSGLSNKEYLRKCSF